MYQPNHGAGGLIMAGAYPTPREEARMLADAMFDRCATSADIQRLNELLTTDLGSLQAYVEQLDFHGELIEQAAEERPENFAASLMNQIERVTALRESRLNWMLAGGTVASIALVLGLIGVLFSPRFFSGASIGTVANLSSEVESRTPIELGQIVRQGKKLNIQKGVATLQLPGVTLDLTGPTTVQLTDARNVELIAGRLHAHVSEGGRGFTVRTRDSVIVDLGTEFIVAHAPDQGTEVSVRKGRVQASLLNWARVPEKVLNVTTERSALLSRTENVAREIHYRPGEFEKIDRLRGSIKSIEGMLRTVEDIPRSVASKKCSTPNHMLVIPEQQQVTLQQELQVSSLNGSVTIPRGAVLSSYLIHYDPDMFMNRAPRGAVTFDGQIAAVLVEADPLKQTDSQFGLNDLEYESAPLRELELDEDEVRISDDRRTVSFYFGVSGVEPLDQVRVLVLAGQSSGG